MIQMNFPMKYRLAIRFTALFLFFAANIFAQIPEKPSPQRLVNDFVGILGESEKQELENKLVAYSDSTSTQIAILIVKELGDYEIADFATRVFEKWEIGKDGKDNGILITLAIDNRKVDIKNGYGIESYLTDALSRRIIEQQIVPYLKRGDYYSALDEATTSIISVLSGTYINDSPDGPKAINWKVVVFIILILILISFFNRNNGGGHTYGKGGRRSHSPPFFMPWGGGGFGGGFGRGSSGGGFGGFGGGSTGGGGASGSW